MARLLFVGAGFYRHERDAQGRPVKHPAPEAQALVAALQPGGRHDFAAEAIVERLMLPLLVEAVHALAEGVVGTPAELDAAMAQMEIAAYKSLLILGQAAGEIDAIRLLQASLSEERAMAAWLDENLPGTIMAHIQLKSAGEPAKH